MNAGKKPPRVIGLSTSLRTARYGDGLHALVAGIKSKQTRTELNAYLREKSRLAGNTFFRDRGDRIPGPVRLDATLEKINAHRALSNSGVAMAAALWGAKNQGVEIRHADLSEHFPPDREPLNLGKLKDQLRRADGFLLSGPVYFGDRSSVAQSLIEMIRTDPQLREDLYGKIYAGIAVGAKRNGGQETTLIYQMLDMMNLGLLAVGNDSETTSQYGGTGKAGDAGTMADDQYGLDTSVGTGNRLARIVQLSNMAKGYTLNGRLRVSIWLLQDRNQFAYRTINLLKDKFQHHKVQLQIMDLTERHIHRCIACDVCPTHVAADSEYRCIIKDGQDLFHQDHAKLIDTDAIVPAAYSPKDGSNLKSVYQKFIERTRYLRRGDYVFSDILVSPLVLEDIGSNENLQIRAMTSMIRHHTIMYRPIIGNVWRDQVLNQADVLLKFKNFVDRAVHFTTGRLRRVQLETELKQTTYNPLGYTQDVKRDEGATRKERRETVARFRHEKLLKDGKSRLIPRTRPAMLGPQDFTV